MKMTRLQTIMTRRSIRKYDAERTIEPEKLESLMRAAMYAPTARNKQPWQFVIITDRDMLDSIPAVHPYSGMLKTATAAILVCGDSFVDPMESYLVQNGSAATQNILLEAHELGLGTVWLGVYGREDRMDGILKLFSLPSHIVPISLIAVGYPAEEKDIPERFNSDCLHHNQYGRPMNFE